LAGLTEMLAAAVGLSAEAAAAAVASCPDEAREFGMTWGELVAVAGAQAVSASAGGGARGALSGGDGSGGAMPSDMKGPVPNTHWVYPRLLCGASAGNMRPSDLAALVTHAKVGDGIALEVTLVRNSGVAVRRGDVAR